MSTEGRNEEDGSSNNFSLRLFSSLIPDKYMQDVAMFRDNRNRREREQYNDVPVEKLMETLVIRASSRESTLQVEPSKAKNQPSVTATAEIPIGQIYVPDPEVRETMEHMVHIAWERQHSNRPLRSQDQIAIDYYNAVLCHLEQPVLEQPSDAKNEPKWMQRLTNRWIRKVEDMMIKIRRENLEIVDDTAENAQLCCICLENFETVEEIERLDCGHRFHMGCIQEWLKVKNLCPLCSSRGYHLNLMMNLGAEGNSL